MATFAQLTTIKAMLGISGGTCAGTTRYDDAITILLDVVDQIILDELDLTSATTTTYTDFIDIDFVGQTEVALRHRPVVSIVGLTINGEAISASTPTTNNGTYVLNKDLGVIKMDPLYYVIPSGRAIVQCTYTAGFDSVPSDLVYAGNLIAVSLFNQQSHVGFQSERTNGYSYNLGSAEGSFVPAMARRILNKHRRLFARGSIYGNMG
tara:strand:+ start:5283 stop:5906 length:624 start_codon:yes stop_codon:yes gene_type:complete